MSREWSFQPSQEKAMKKPAIVRYTEAKKNTSNSDQYLFNEENFQTALDAEISSFISQGNFSGLHEYIKESETGLANLPDELKEGSLGQLYGYLFRDLKHFFMDVPPLRLREYPHADQIADKKIDGVNFIIDIIKEYATKKKNGNLGFDPEKIKVPYSNPYDRFLDSGSYIVNLHLAAFPEKTRVKANIDELIEAYLSLTEKESKDNENLNRSGTLGELFREKSEYVADRLLFNLSQNQQSDKHRQFLTILLSDTIGAEETRKKLNDALQKERKKSDDKQQAVIDNLESVRALITPNHEKIAVESLLDLYENKIKFESYGLNEKMQEKEVALLEELIEKNQDTLEAGIGTGRLFLELQKSGYDITGFDFTQRHIALVKGELPDAKIFKGDWKQTGLKDKSFDVEYSLGRNILHEYSLPDQAQMFREAARVLKKGGKFIFDIPDRDKGEYHERVQNYADAMYSFGVNNYRYGAIYDSPNGINFATRYAYSNEDIENLAQFAGFKIAEIHREELPTGKGDENLYYVLEKI